MVKIIKAQNNKAIHSGAFADIRECLVDGVIKGVSFKGADLRDVDLRDVDLRDVDLRGADLRDVDLRGATLWGADLRGADLRGATLWGADLRGVDLRGVDLRDADLRGADLRDVDLRGADLRDADLRDADLRDADLRDADLTKGSVYIGVGEAYRLFISPEVVHVGRQSHTPAAWRAMSKRHLAAMDSGGRAVKYYPRLLDLLDFYLGKGAHPEWVTS